ncbi:MAG: AraC family transcriptional regulator [Muribaculaceae bacterium]|nr:AraC family transcriptional regulator [Muribaculaceae bacterium]
MKDFQKEITPIAEDDLFIVLNHPNAKFDYPVHYHPDYEINLVLNATGTRIVGDTEEDFGKVDLVMTGPNLPHAWKSNCHEGHHVITIQFSEKILEFPILQKRLFSSIKELLMDSRRGLLFSEASNSLIVDKIVKLTRLQGFQTALEFFSILYDLSISNRQVLVSNQYDKSSIVSSAKSRRIMKVCEYIDANYEEQVKLSDVSALVNMSESAFSHFFKKKTGCSFIDYLNNIRISKASLMLSDTTNSINEICYSCGFNNSSNFIRIFKKIKGMTPSEYRTYIQQMLIKY